MTACASLWQKIRAQSGLHHVRKIRDGVRNMKKAEQKAAKENEVRTEKILNLELKKAGSGPETRDKKLETRPASSRRIANQTKSSLFKPIQTKSNHPPREPHRPPKKYYLPNEAK